MKTSRYPRFFVFRRIDRARRSGRCVQTWVSANYSWVTANSQRVIIRYLWINGDYLWVNAKYLWVIAKYPWVNGKYPWVNGKYPWVNGKYPWVNGSYPEVNGASPRLRNNLLRVKVVYFQRLTHLVPRRGCLPLANRASWPDSTPFLGFGGEMGREGGTSP